MVPRCFEYVDEFGERLTGNPRTRHPDAEPD
jgi:hypothetical protein